MIRSFAESVDHHSRGDEVRNIVLDRRDQHGIRFGQVITADAEFMQPRPWFRSWATNATADDPLR